MQKDTGIQKYVCAIITYGSDSWVSTQKKAATLQAADIIHLKRNLLYASQSVERNSEVQPVPVVWSYGNDRK